MRQLPLPTRTIAGRIDSAGNVQLANEPITVSHTAASGVYLIVFPPNFRIITGVASPAMTGGQRGCDVTVNPPNGIRVDTTNSSTGAVADFNFGFIAVGVTG